MTGQRNTLGLTLWHCQLSILMCRRLRVEYPLTFHRDSLWHDEGPFYCVLGWNWTIRQDGALGRDPGISQ